MTQGERVKEIRKSLKLSLEKFGSGLGVGKTAISKIEKGENSLTAQMAKAICNEYRVNYEYLESGTGEMFSDLPENAIDELCEQYELDDFDRVLIQEYVQLDAASRKVLKEYVRRISARTAADDTQARIDAEVEAYRRELEEEARQAEKSSVSDTQGENTKMA